MLSLNITDEYSLHDFPSSREMTPLPLASPRALSPFCISRSNSVPDIVITVNEENRSSPIDIPMKDTSADAHEENEDQTFRARS